MPIKVELYSCEYCGKSYIKESLAVSCEELCQRRFALALDRALFQVRENDFPGEVAFFIREHKWLDLLNYLNLHVKISENLVQAKTHLILETCARKLCELQGIKAPESFIKAK